MSRYRRALTPPETRKRLDDLVDSSDYTMKEQSLQESSLNIPLTLENTTMVTAQKELALLTYQLNAIEELIARKSILAKRAKVLEKFITTIAGLCSTEQNIVTTLLETVSSVLTDEKTEQLPDKIDSSDSDIPKNRLSDFE